MMYNSIQLQISNSSGLKKNISSLKFYFINSTDFGENFLVIEFEIPLICNLKQFAIVIKYN